MFDLMALRHPIYNPLGLGNTANSLEAEYRAHPLGRRLKWLKQWIRLETLLFLSGQSYRRVKRLPTDARKVLYAYDWGAIGDSIMDLSQRQLIPEEIQLDLYMPAKASVLFEGDVRFRNVYRTAADCPADYDLIILHNISPALVKFKMQWYRDTSFYDVLGFLQGELYDRMYFCHVGLTRLLGLVDKPLFAPRIGARHISEVVIQRGSIAVALGAMDESRRHYARWQSVLDSIHKGLTSIGVGNLRFVLVGSGDSAHKDLERLDPGFVASYCEVRLDLPSLEAVQQQIASCEYFIGADGGLMHIASALDKPGVALFAEVLPQWRLLPSSRLHPICAPKTVNTIAIEEIVNAFMRIAGKAKNT